MYIYTYTLLRNRKNLTCNEREALRIIARNVLGVPPGRAASPRGWPHVALDSRPNAGAVVSGRQVLLIFLLYLLQLYVFYQLLTPERTFCAR